MSATGDDSRLGGEHVRVVRLDLPQRPQAERVHREDVLVTVSRDQRDRALGERAHRLAQVHVEAAQVLGELTDLVHDRRHGKLHRLRQRQGAPVDQRLDEPVQVLGVGGVVPDRRAQHQGLGAQAGDRVDLAVVAEDRERLHAHEGRPRVRGVTVVAQQRGGLAARVREVVEVPLQHQRCTHHLVDASVGGEERQRVRQASPRSRSRRRTARDREPRRRAPARRPARSGAPPRARCGPAPSCRRGPPARPARAGRRDGTPAAPPA